MVFRGKCALVTSYNPMAKDVTLEGMGGESETDKQFIYNTYTALLENVVAAPGKTKTETYEDKSKALFIAEPANMKLLVVVDKLLTGFDAPLLHLPLHRQVHAGSWPVSGDLPHQPARRRGQGFRLHRRLQGPVQKGRERHRRLHVRNPHQRGRCVPPEVLVQDRLKKGKEVLDTAFEMLVLRCASPSSRRRASWSISTISAATPRFPTDLTGA